MGLPRDTYKFHFIVGDRIMDIGITTDTEHRERELRQRWPKGRLIKIGTCTTRNSAKKWERQEELKIKRSKPWFWPLLRLVLLRL